MTIFRKDKTRLPCIILSLAILFGGIAAAAEGGGPINGEQAQAIALARTGGGQVVELDRHNRGPGVGYFRVEILGSDGAYHVEIDANSGNVLKFVRKGGYKGIVVPTGTPISYEQALDIALRQTGGGAVVESDIDYKKSGRVVYEFEIRNDGVKYEIEIDGGNGAIIEFERNGRHISLPPPAPDTAAPAATPPAAAQTVAPQPKLGAATAQALAQSAVGGGMVIGYTLDSIDGRFVHEVSIVKDNRRYLLAIIDETGAAREMSVRDAQ